MAVGKPHPVPAHNNQGEYTVNKVNPAPKAYSVEAFCKAHGISRAMYYVLKKKGKAPRTFRVGSKPLRTCS